MKSITKTTLKVGDFAIVVCPHPAGCPDLTTKGEIVLLTAYTSSWDGPYFETINNATGTVYYTESELRPATVEEIKSALAREFTL